MSSNFKIQWVFSYLSKAFASLQTGCHNRQCVVSVFQFHAVLTEIWFKAIEVTHKYCCSSGNLIWANIFTRKLWFHQDCFLGINDYFKNLACRIKLSSYHLKKTQKYVKTERLMPTNLVISKYFFYICILILQYSLMHLLLYSDRKMYCVGSSC